MEAHEFVDDDDTVWQIDWNDLPDFAGILDEQAPDFTVSPSNQGLSNPSPDSVSSWIGEVENLLMNDDAEEAGLETDIHICDDFLLDIPVHSPNNVSVEVVAGGNSNHSSQATADDDLHKQNNGRIITVQETGTDVFADIVADSPISASTEFGHAPIAGNSDVSSHGSGNGDLEKVQEAINDVDDPNDPVSKKRRRQLRNRDAAVRSRERKKMYVKDLEMKSRYLEGECRRLGRLLQCFIAENQALRLSLQRGSAFDASSAEQESAVLLMDGGKRGTPSRNESILRQLPVDLDSEFNYGDNWNILLHQQSPLNLIPAVGFPALVPGHHVPIQSANTAQVNRGGSSSGKRGKERPRTSGCKRGRK